MTTDHDILVAALGPAVAEYEAKTARYSFLARPRPDGEILGPVEQAIDQCAAYQDVAGYIL
jgi:hypothetical protein